MEAIFYTPGEENVRFSTRNEVSPDLQAFFVGMADPPLDTLHGAVIGFSKIPLNRLEGIKSALLSAIYDGRYYEKSLVARGIPQNQAEQIAQGAENTGKLVDEVIDCFDRSTKLPYKGMDTLIIAQRRFENMQVDKAEAELEKASTLVLNEPNINRRTRLARDLQKRTLGYIDKFNVDVCQSSTRDKPLDPTWNNLTLYRYWNAEIHLAGHSSRSTWVLGHAVMIAHAALTRRALERKISKLPPIDQERREVLRLQYGAKAANLIILAEMADRINGERIMRSKIKVPEFKVVPASLYNLWKERQSADQEILVYYEWASSLRKENHWGEPTDEIGDYIVRSSAVHSEDGEEITGAGIYDSVIVPGGSSFEEFKGAVLSVYGSTDSENAIAYRKQHGIPKEEMGLVIQKFVGPDTETFSPRGSGEGYVNTILPGVPGLMEIKTGRSRNFIKRKELDFYLALDDGDDYAFRNVHQFKPDIHKVFKNTLVRVAQISSAIEKVWGHGVQIEFLARGLRVNVVQVRDIPRNLFDIAKQVEFPGEPEIHTGASIGVGDMVLEVLDEDKFNGDKTGAVVFGSNQMWTMWGNYDSLPESGAVIIVQPHGDYGHIQLLCSEKGLVCIYPDSDFYDKPHLDYKSLSELKKVRIVSNGMEARLYQVPGEKDPPDPAYPEDNN